MPSSRRLLLASSLALGAAPFGLRAQEARIPEPDAVAPETPAPEAPAPQAATPPAAPQGPVERTTGLATAPVTVIEYFSLTCGHCAAFHRETWPQVKAQLVDTGRVRMVWRDFPLDQVAAAGAMVARALPPERYEAFVGTLLVQQDNWAFSRDPRAGLARLARLAGMSQEQFEATLRNQALLDEVRALRDRGEAEHGVNSTPTFVFNRTVVPGNLSIERFTREVTAAMG